MPLNVRQIAGLGAVMLGSGLIYNRERLKLNLDGFTRFREVSSKGDHECIYGAYRDGHRYFKATRELDPARTRFPIGEVSRLFATMACLRLQEKRIVSLDEMIEARVPDAMPGLNLQNGLIYTEKLSLDKLVAFIERATKKPYMQVVKEEITDELDIPRTWATASNPEITSTVEDLLTFAERWDTLLESPSGKSIFEMSLASSDGKDARAAYGKSGDFRCVLRTHKSNMGSPWEGDVIVWKRSSW